MNKTIKLNDGNTIPTIGLGTWKAKPNEVGEAVKFAISNAGYKHIDCASIYRNEKEIGEGLSDSFSKNVKREEIFITSKLWNTFHRPKDVEKALRQTLSDLKLDYLDLYLMHWGIAFEPGGEMEPVDKNGKVIFDNTSIQETWSAMEELVKKGLVKSIGVANFTTIMIFDLLTYAKIKPAINQIELHAYNNQKDTVSYLQDKEIAVTAYSPLGRHGVEKNNTVGRNNLFEEEIVKEIANTHNKSISQVLLNWALKRGTTAIPKSVTPERLLENIDVFDFELGNDEMEKINSLNKNYRFVNPQDWWDIPYFS